jgi:signal transduction histidine kinase
MFLDENREKVELIARSFSPDLVTARSGDDVHAADYEKLNTKLDTLLEGGEYSELSILDGIGVVLASTDDASVGYDRSVDPLFLEGREQTYIEDAHASNISGKPVISISTPIREENELLGVMIADISMTKLNEITTDRTGLGKSGEIYLVNKDGYMITPSRFLAETFLKQKVDIEELFGIPGYTQAFLSTNYLGSNVLRVCTYFPETKWCLLAEMGEKEAFEPVDKLLRLMLSLLVGLSAAGIMISVLISSAITKPLMILHVGTEEIVKGNLEYKVGAEGKDEIGELSRAFDTMTAKLKASREELEKYSKGLEKMVEVRTKELNEKVKEVEEQRLKTLNMLKEVNETKKELERANRDLEDFSSTVSHDLKMPLRAIQAFTTLLMEDYADTLDETGRGYINKVKEAVERMIGLIEDLLKLSRVGRKFTEVEIVDLNDLVEEIKSDLSARIEEQGGEVVVVGKLPSISTQRVWMKELFMNLIDNGLKFNKSKKPRVEVSCEEISAATNLIRNISKGDWLFKVKDNGIGIEENDKARIFNLFERVHSQSNYEGTGAGLAICKKIVEELGGTLQVESKPKEGSTFFFVIPKSKSLSCK